MDSITSEIDDLWGAFFSQHHKFNVDSKNGKKMPQNVSPFPDKLIWIGKCKFSLLLQENL